MSIEREIMSIISDSFVASVALALNSAQVPCVLWGHYLLNVHGIPSIIAVSIDQQARYISCTKELQVY